MKTVKLAYCGRFLFTLVLSMALWAKSSIAQTSPPVLVPFNDFLKEVSSVPPINYLAGPTSRVKTVAAFEEMRQYILTMYQGVTVAHSFLSGPNPVDCIPIMQQPSVRMLGLENLAVEPPAPPPAPSGLNRSPPLNSRSA